MEDFIKYQVFKIKNSDMLINKRFYYQADVM